MDFRRLNDAGIAAFGDYLDRLRADPTLAPPTALLSDPATSQPLTAPISAEPEPFANRMAFARWLHEAATTAGHPVPRADKGFWAWLSLALFDQVCPWQCGKRGKWKGKMGRYPGDDARHILDINNHLRRYRHLLSGPYAIYRVHLDNPERALAALVNPLDEPGDLSEQLGGSRLHALCPGTMALATELFVDRETMRPRKGAGAASKRLGKLMNQYTRTWDLPVMAPDALAHMLPEREFKKFVAAAESPTAAAVP